MALKRGLDDDFIGYRRPVAHKISLTAMFAAFSVIFLYLAAIMPYGRLTLYLISSLFVTGVLVEDMRGAAFLMYIVVSLLGILLAGLYAALPYILLFGHYGIGKFYIERIKDKVIAYVVKLLYWNVCMAGIYFLAFGIMVQGTLASVPLWGLVIIAQIAFVVFDIIYSKLTTYYWEHIRPRLVRG